MRQLFCDSEFHAYAIIRQILYIYTHFFDVQGNKGSPSSQRPISPTFTSGLTLIYEIPVLSPSLTSACQTRVSHHLQSA